MRLPVGKVIHIRGGVEDVGMGYAAKQGPPCPHFPFHATPGPLYPS